VSGPKNMLFWIIVFSILYIYLFILFIYGSFNDIVSGSIMASNNSMIHGQLVTLDV
jgi:hypothetical protein